MDDDEETRLNQKKQKDNENEKLWQDLKIDFRLEAFKFPDNKIYGIIHVIPESSRRLIKKFILVVNKSNRIEFEPHFQYLSASGFNINRKNPSAYLEAIPNNTKWAKEIKTSKICYFFFTGEVFALNPTISFDWPSNEEHSQARLIINWYHIGDKHAQKYVLYLDDIDVQYIRQKLINEAFDVRIEGFQAGEKHTFQLAARLNNGKETYRSDLIEFIVPSKELMDENSIEFISVSHEPIPHNLPALIATKEDKTEEEFNQNIDKNPKQEQNLNQDKSPKQKPNLNQDENPKQETNLNQDKNPKQEQNLNQNKNLNQHKNELLLKQIEKQGKEKKKKKKKKIYTCCDQVPHDTFPGIEHYFKKTLNKVSLSQDNRTTSSDENGEETGDDDDDVVITSHD